jgi:hypothetical protein
MVYYLIVGKTGRHTFYLANPKDTGCKLAFREVNCTFPDDLLTVPEGKPYPNMADFCLGQSKSSAKQYMAFASKSECEKAGYLPLGNDFGERQEWSKDDE